MKKILWRNIFREFKFSIARFVSVTTLIVLGVFVLVGLKNTGPDMRMTANQYYNQQNMADAVITSNTDISKSDQIYMKTLPHVKQIEFSTYQDAVIKNSGNAIRLNTVPDKVSTVKISKGRLPKSNHEIALNEQESSKYKLGDSIQLTNNKGNKSPGLKSNSYKIVGFISSPDYLKKTNMGQTSAGNGQIETFGILTKSAFLNTTPKLAKISYDNVSGNAYSDEYENSVKKDVDASVNRVRNRGIARTNTTKQSQLVKIDAAEQQLNVKQTNLNLQKTQLGNNSQIIAAQDMLNRSRNDLKTKRHAIQNNDQQINYKLQSRNDYNSGYNQYGENAKRIDMLSNTFPIIFFLVALLVCFTTMSRMASEKRTELGTERALGYSKFDTLKVFIVYGLSTGILGSILGTILGTGFLPKKIFAAYSANFLIPDFQTPIQPFWMIIAIIISIAVTTLPALYSANFELKELPATLMLPKAPKDGTRILLERIPFIWKKLSFNYKIMFRNLARYKSRMFMTIIGVAGCTALLITGFGIKDSLNSILTNQYQQIVHYDAISIYNPDSSIKDLSNYNDKIVQQNGVKDRTKIYYEQVSTHATDNLNDQTVSLLVPKNTESFKNFVTLKNPETNKKFKLPNNGIVITQKLAKLTNKKVGDHIVIKTTNGKDHTVKIAKITQMYAGHAVYMSPSYYKKVFTKPVIYNANMLKLKDKSINNVNKLSRNLNRSKSAVTVIQSNDEKVTINNILYGLNNLVIIITFAASLLAFAVLFTLTNINVSERIRELSTIKVLGFYPIEVIMYVYRETFFLTIVGILFGWLGGNYLHRYIMQTLPPDNAMTSLNLIWTNPTISAILTIIFSIIVMTLMAHKINKIDMLGALKSVD